MNLALLAGSLIAVLATAGVVAWLGLGRDGAIPADDSAALAEAMIPGFEAAESYPDRDGRAALVRGADGSWALLRLHGLHPAARHLPVRPPLTRDGDAVIVDSGERTFGRVRIVHDTLLTLV